MEIVVFILKESTKLDRLFQRIRQLTFELYVRPKKQNKPVIYNQFLESMRVVQK